MGTKKGLEAQDLLALKGDEKLSLPQGKERGGLFTLRVEEGKRRGGLGGGPKGTCGRVIGGSDCLRDSWEEKKNLSTTKQRGKDLAWRKTKRKNHFAKKLGVTTKGKKTKSLNPVI